MFSLVPVPATALVVFVGMAAIAESVTHGAAVP